MAESRRHKSRKGKTRAGRGNLSRVGTTVFVALLIAIVSSGVLLVESAQHTRHLYHQLGELQREQDDLLETHSRLSLERSTISSLGTIESVAMEALDMHFPREIRRIDP